MRVGYRLLGILLMCACLLSSCVLRIPTEDFPTPPSRVFAHVPMEMPVVGEDRDPVFWAASNDYSDTGLSWIGTADSPEEGVAVYCALPVFPTEEDSAAFASRARQWLDSIQKDLPPSCTALKVDFNLVKIRSFCRLDVSFWLCEEKTWRAVDGYSDYWDPKTGSFVSFLSFFSDFPEYSLYLAEYLRKKCEEELKQVCHPQRMEAFLLTDLTFSRFEITEEGLTVILDETNLLKDGEEARLVIPDEYCDGRIVEMLLYPWRGYRPAQPGEKVIALTFDDGPKREFTDRVLDALEKYQAKATFFVVGSAVNKRTAPILQRMVSLGCQIGNHSYSHPNFKKMTNEKMLEELARTQGAVYGATGLYPTCMRPPGGNLEKERVDDTGMFAVWWNEDTLDWKYRDTQALVEYVKEHASSGDIVLMHDIHLSTVDAVEEIVQWLIEDGYRLVTVEELFDLRNSEPSDIKYYSQNTLR